MKTHALNNISHSSKNQLIIVKYEGERFRNSNFENITKNFQNDCGLIPSQILDQVNKTELVNFFTNYSQKSDKLIIHIISHGCRRGICQILSGSDNMLTGDIKTLIEWEEIISLFNAVSKNCSDLILNLGGVCSSAFLKNCKQPITFDALVALGTVTDQVEPRKLIKDLISNIDNVNIGENYLLLRKNT